MTLEELKASAPRTFDKTLVDLLVSIQSGGQPIIVAQPSESPDMAPAVLRMAHGLDAASSRLDAASAQQAQMAEHIVVLEQRLKRLESMIIRLAMEAMQQEAA